MHKAQRDALVVLYGRPTRVVVRNGRAQRAVFAEMERPGNVIVKHILQVGRAPRLVHHEDAVLLLKGDAAGIIIGGVGVVG